MTFQDLAENLGLPQVQFCKLNPCLKNTPTTKSNLHADLQFNN